MLKDKLKKIKLLALDVDGILTDGKIVYGHDGKEIKVFNVQDGYGIVLLRKAGLKTAIISARKARAVTVRAADLRIDKVYQNAKPKLNVYKRMLVDLKLKDESVCFMGDDLPDRQVLKQAGLAVTVPDANQDVKKCAHYVTRKKGGQGAVREVIEMILKAQGKWEKIVEEA